MCVGTTSAAAPGTHPPDRAVWRQSRDRIRVYARCNMWMLSDMRGRKLYLCRERAPDDPRLVAVRPPASDASDLSRSHTGLFKRRSERRARCDPSLRHCPRAGPYELLPYNLAVIGARRYCLSQTASTWRHFKRRSVPLSPCAIDTAGLCRSIDPHSNGRVAKIRHFRGQGPLHSPGAAPEDNAACARHMPVRCGQQTSSGD